MTHQSTICQDIRRWLMRSGAITKTADTLRATLLNRHKASLVWRARPPLCKLPLHSRALATLSLSNSPMDPIRSKAYLSYESFSRRHASTSCWSTLVESNIETSLRIYNNFSFRYVREHALNAPVTVSPCRIYKVWTSGRKQRSRIEHSYPKC